MTTFASGGNGNNGAAKSLSEDSYDGPITDADLERLVTLFGAQLHAAGFKKATTRKGLQVCQEEIARDMIQMLKRYADRFKGFVVRPTIIGDEYDPQKAIGNKIKSIFE